MKEKTSTRTKKTEPSAAPAKTTKAKASKPVAKEKEVPTATAKTPKARATKAAKPAKTQIPSATPALTQDEIAVAAFLNWCNRRNEGLPDDPFADWITAESEIGLAN